MKKTIPYFFSLFFLTACAISRKVDYEKAYMNVPAFNQRMAIACWDRREQIVSGARKTDFVGYMRSGAGIAYPMGTETGRPFADIMSEDIGNAFGKKGNQVAVVNTQPTDKETLILEQLRKTNSNRLILINCNEFYTDGYGTISLMYNLKLNIYSEKGELLLEKSYHGKRLLGGSGWGGPGKYKQYIPEGFRKLIEEIFSDAEITPLLQH